MNPREEIAHLTEVLERANHQYYVLDAPEMEDYEYDRLLRRLEELGAPQDLEPGYRPAPVDLPPGMRTDFHA